jgi:hypothetical protein
MRFFTIVSFISLFIFGCGNTKTVNLPPAPANADAVFKTITGKKFKTAELALVSNLAADKNNPYEWFDEIKDTTPYFRNYEKQKMKFEINFINDTSAEITDEAGVNKADWKIDNQPKSDETAGLFLRLSMERQEKLVPGQVSSSMVTFSYKVLGIDDKQLFLQTPNMFNSKKIAALMKTE